MHSVVTARFLGDTGSQPRRSLLWATTIGLIAFAVAGSPVCLGGAIAAGAAIGFVTAAAAASWAGAPPPPGYYWYYTDQSRTQGFWDVCPQ